MGEESLASQLTWQKPFGLFSVGRSWVKCLSSASKQNRRPDQEDEGGDGVPRQGHRGEGLQEILPQDRGRRCRWRRFYWIWEFLIYSPVIFFFTSIKSDHFQLCCVIFYETFQNSGNIAATLYCTAYLTQDHCYSPCRAALASEIGRPVCVGGNCAFFFCARRLRFFHAPFSSRFHSLFLAMRLLEPNCGKKRWGPFLPVTRNW